MTSGPATWFVHASATVRKRDAQGAPEVMEHPPEPFAVVNPGLRQVIFHRWLAGLGGLATRLPRTAISSGSRPNLAVISAVETRSELSAKYTYCEAIIEGRLPAHVPSALLYFAAVQDRERPSPASGNGL